jgi:hypothetical protein
MYRGSKYELLIFYKNLFIFSFKIFFNFRFFEALHHDRL